MKERLQDFGIDLETATPEDFKSVNPGLEIRAGFAPSPFGICFIAQTPRGICRLSFVDSEKKREALELLQKEWPAAKIFRDDASAASLAKRIFSPSFKKGDLPLRAFVKGTPFQASVWRALLNIRRGELTTYGRLARTLGKSSAARAVGSAVGRNPVAYLIPCHRVIRGTGAIGDYHWGRIRKKKILAWEGAFACP